MNINKMLLPVLLLVVLLSSCNGRPTAAQIKAEGEVYAQKSDADQRALYAEQTRDFANQKQSVEMVQAQYRMSLWETWKPNIVHLGNFALQMLLFSVFTMGITLAVAGSSVIWGTSQAALVLVKIRAGLVPIDRQTRLPRAFIYSQPVLSPVTNGLLAKVQDATGLTFTNTHGSKWTIVNAATGQVMVRFDENRPADLAQLEVERQVINHWITMNQMKESGLFSAHGEVAEAMSDAVPQIPGANVHADFRMLVQEVISGVRDEMAN